LTKLWHIKRDHLANFYILREKTGKMRYLCNNLTDLHKIQRDNAERAFEVIGCKKINFKIPRYNDRPNLENRQIAILHDDTERVSQAYRLSAILNFLNDIFNGRRTWDTYSA